MKKVKDFFYNHKGLTVATVASSIVALPSMAFADTAPSGSLMTPEVQSTITGFAGNIVPTVLALIAILVPTGLTLWAIGFGIKKGLRFLQSKASQSI